MDIEKASQMLDALGHPTRLKLFHAIAEAGVQGIPVGGLTERFRIPAGTVSHHLAKLTGAGLVRQDRSKTTLRCVAESAALMKLSAYLLTSGERGAA